MAALRNRNWEQKSISFVKNINVKDENNCTFSTFLIRFSFKSMHLEKQKSECSIPFAKLIIIMIIIIIVSNDDSQLVASNLNSSQYCALLGVRLHI